MQNEERPSRSAAIGKKAAVGIGQDLLDETTHRSEVAFVTLDRHQGKGIGAELLVYLTLPVKRQGLPGFTATVLRDNTCMLRLFERAGFAVEKSSTRESPR